ATIARSPEKENSPPTCSSPRAKQISTLLRSSPLGAIRRSPLALHQSCSPRANAVVKKLVLSPVSKSPAPSPDIFEDESCGILHASQPSYSIKSPEIEKSDNKQVLQSSPDIFLNSPCSSPSETGSMGNDVQAKVTITTGKSVSPLSSKIPSLSPDIFEEESCNIPQTSQQPSDSEKFPEIEKSGDLLVRPSSPDLETTSNPVNKENGMKVCFCSDYYFFGLNISLLRI
ncbi:ATP-binding cassette sub-family C member Sur, partial [Frankliniella fusca]